MGVDDSTVEDKLLKKSIEMYFSVEDPMKLTIADFQKKFAKVSPLITDRGSIKYILRWIGLYNFPKIYPVAISII